MSLTVPDWKHFLVGFISAASAGMFITNTVYYSRLRGDGGNGVISSTTATGMMAVNIILCILSLIVLVIIFGMWGHHKINTAKVSGPPVSQSSGSYDNPYTNIQN